MTKVLHCALRIHFGRAYLKLDPKNTLQNGANFVVLLGSESAFSLDTLTQN